MIIRVPSTSVTSRLGGKGALPGGRDGWGRLAGLVPALRVRSPQWRKQADDPDAYLQRG